MSSVDEQSAHNNATSTLAAAEESKDDTSAHIQYQDKEQEEDGDGAASRDSNSDDVDSDSDDCKKSDSPDSDEEEESEGEGTGDDEGSALVPLNIGPGVFAPRTDAFPLPSLGDEESWVWEPAPNSIIQTMTDFTLAHQRAAKEIWPTASFIFGMCSYHAWNAWRNHHKKFFKDYDKYKTRMGKDFEQYKKSPWGPLIPVLRELMMEKWRSKYKEKNIAHHWFKQWSKTVHTRVELNGKNLLRGGLPAHNNNSEGRNSGDKVRLDHRKPLTTTFITDLDSMLADCSKGDLVFCNVLHKNVHCKKHYRTVYDILCRSDSGEATFLTVTFGFTSRSMQIPEGSLLVATTSFLDHGALQDLLDVRAQHHKHQPLSDKNDAHDIIRFIKNEELHTDYKKLLRNPKDYCQGLSFDEVLQVTKRFHLMEPILIHTPQDEAAIGNLLKVLSNCGLAPISVASLKAMGNQGLLSCHCATYMACAWCKHACAFAHKRGIIKDYPVTMHPKQTIKTKAGRFKKARRGGALDRE